MTLQALLYVIGTIVCAIAFFVPAIGTRSYNLLAAGVAFLGAGLAAGAI